MFGKAFMINFCSVLVVLSALGSSFAMPIVRRADSVKVARQLDTIVPGAQIPPVLVDLYDQYKNLQDQVIAATEGSPLRESLLKQLDAAKLVLEEKMKGIAVFAASTITVSSSTSTSASTSSTSVTSTTVSASSIWATL
ncbi:hypothetical protein B0H34DRAFT_51472 [Crassisporium funariophilum]|nr:hypothetical protein B0H34DRAFT_51472 [Crassisporium funariophilum]